MICAALEAELSPFVVARPTALSNGESSTARPASIGTEPIGPENDRGQEAALTVEQCRCGLVHQPRERRVPCLSCRRRTRDIHALCSACRGDAP